MWWLWIVGPIAVVCIYLLTGTLDKRRLREIELWRGSWGKGRSGARRAGVLPADLTRLAVGAGAGVPLGIFELVPKTAYLAVYGPDATSGSDSQMILAKLAAGAPAFTVRPLPIVD